jgi:hypothetical protein
MRITISLIAAVFIGVIGWSTIGEAVDSSPVRPVPDTRQGEEEPVHARVFDFTAGFNAMVFSGESGTPVDRLAATMGPDVEAIFRFDAVSQRWDTYRPAVTLPVLNTLQTLQQGDALFVRARVPLSFAWADTVTEGAFPARFEPGFTSVGFLGASGTFVVEAFALYWEAISAVWVFDSTAQSWGVFRPGPTRVPNTVDTIQRGDLLFVQNSLGTSVLGRLDRVAFNPQPEPPEVTPEPPR